MATDLIEKLIQQLPPVVVSTAYIAGGRQKDIYLLIAKLTVANGTAVTPYHVNVIDIANVLGITKAGASSVFFNLRKRGFVTVEHRIKGVGSIYSLNVASDAGLIVPADSMFVLVDKKKLIENALKKFRELKLPKYYEFISKQFNKMIQS